MKSMYFSVYASFQSTLPARGATRVQSAARADRKDFNPRSPHGERHDSASAFCSLWHFNPRSPHGERLYQAGQRCKHGRFQSTLPARGATNISASSAVQSIFQSTLPARGATTCWHSFSPTSRISIHAPRTGSDRAYICSLTTTAYFNPRSPHGERR